MGSKDNSINNKENAPIKPVRTKLYVSNFPENTTRRSLTEFFSKFGQVLECAIMWDKYAFIHYGTMEEAQNALRRASGMFFMGQKLFIQLSTSRNRQNCNWYQKEAEKLLAKCQNNSGDTSFMSSSSSSNLVETKLYVTNLPDNCNQQELKELFENFGHVLECVIMWNHYAFIHFADFNEAKYALDNLHGSLFNGKNLIVQMSTSSNRPLPKCLAFGQTKQNTSLLNKSKEIKLESSILCYRASDLEKNEFACAKESNLKQEKNWIQIIKDGCLPVVADKAASEPEKKSFDLNKLFLSLSKTESIPLSGIPTPEMPDLSLKIPCLNPKAKPISFDQIPTPPLPSCTPDNQTENDSLKKLIENINNNSKQEIEEVDKNEKILIDRLNMLKDVNYFDDTKIRSLWSISEVDVQSSSGVSTASSVRSLSPPTTTSTTSYSIDYLNKNCVYKENLIKKDDRHTIQQQITQSSIKKSRCKLVNYLLFPEVREENFLNKNDYESVLIDLIKKNCELIDQESSS